MVAALSLVSVVSGAGIACAAAWKPAKRASIALERCGGVLFLAGLALLGVGLPHFP